MHIEKCKTLSDSALTPHKYKWVKSKIISVVLFGFRLLCDFLFEKRAAVAAATVAAAAAHMCLIFLLFNFVLRSFNFSTFEPPEDDIVGLDSEGYHYIKNLEDLQAMPLFTLDELLTLQKMQPSRLWVSGVFF